MQHVLRRLAKRAVSYRNAVPTPVYDAMREAYRRLNASRYAKTPTEFDTAFYLQNNPNVAIRNMTPYQHFLKSGHKDLRNPNADFDIVWYLQNYGHTFDAEKIDPLTHFLTRGKSKGYLPHPPRRVAFNKNHSRPLPDGAKRACLFAGYDPDGLIDEYVIIYLKELAKHSDVFYLADCDMPRSELAKLDGIAAGAWAKRHGAYDFGSYSALARDLVGWDKLSQYDEVIFANDSAYLIRPLDEVFARMDEKPCAWWGLQATKGLISTRIAQPFPVAEDHIDMNVVISEHLGNFEYDPIYDFHIGSYFLAFRRDVINNVNFQRLINSIESENSKLNIIKKYELGITRFLIGHGYELATWGKQLTKSHPVYTDVAFDLIDCGFPILKRYFITENHYKASSISYWRRSVEDVDSITSPAVIENNLHRTSNAEKMHRNLNIMDDGVLPRPLMSHAEFLEYDDTTPKYDNYWGFPVCRYDHTLSDNSRAVFEQIKNDPSITKVIFTRSRFVKVDGINVISVPLKSYEGQIYLARCRNLFVRHGAKTNIEWPVQAENHNIINLWHGIPLKRIGLVSLDQRDPLQQPRREAENSRLRAIISASDVDRLAMAAAFAPKAYEDIWLTGLPRHDFVTREEENLPEFLRAQLDDIRHLTGGRRLVLFCPTFRNDQENGYYDFTPTQVERLAGWLNEHDMVMGVREHLADQAKQYSSQLVGNAFVSVGSRRFPDIEMLYREAAMLVTDYSSCFIDYMLTGQPMVSFAFDFESYKERERGLFYELEDVFPGPIAQTFDDLLQGLDVSVAQLGTAPSQTYQAKCKFFIKFTDSENSERVVQQTKILCDGSRLLSDFQIEGHLKIENSITFLYASDGNISNRYRVFSLISELRELGWACHAMEIKKIDIKIISQSAFVTFCSLELSTQTLDLAESIRGSGGKVVYDTDDIIHDPDIFFRSDRFSQDRKQANRLGRSSAQAAQMMMMADAFTVATPALRRSVERFGKPVAIVDNSISRSLLDKYARLPRREPDNTVRVCYLSGTAAGSRDFAECGAALSKLLNARSNVELHVVGQLDVGDFFAQPPREGQIHKHGLMPYAAMHEFLHTMDINLAPLSKTEFNDGKSALKIFEAALHSVPTVASPSEPYRNAIKDKRTGYLADTPDDWYTTLVELVDKPKKYIEVGNAARKEIVPLFTANVAANQLSGFLNRLR